MRDIGGFPHRKGASGIFYNKPAWRDSKITKPMGATPYQTPNGAALTTHRYGEARGADLNQLKATPSKTDR